MPYKDQFTPLKAKNYDSKRGIFAGADENGKAATANNCKR